MPAAVAHYEGDYVLDIEPGQPPGPFGQVSRVSGNPFVPTLNGDFVLRTSGVERGRIKADGTTTGVFAAGTGGGVSSVTAGDASVVVGGTGANPTLETGTLDLLAALHPPAADWGNNGHKITGLANGSAVSDAAAFGQIPTALPPNGAAGGDLAGSYPAPTIKGSVGLTGTPTAPTALAADNSTAIATTAFVKAQGYLTSAPVASVFARTGAVVAAAGDYTAAQVTNAADKSASATQAFTGSVTAAELGMLSSTATVVAGTFAVTTSQVRLTATDASTVTTITGPVSGALLVLENATGSAVSFGTGGGANGISFAFTLASGERVLLSFAVLSAVWIPYAIYRGATGGPANVSSVFGRTGIVVAASGDYTAAQVTNAADKASASLQAFTGGLSSAHASQGIGYATGAGGTIAQGTSRTTTVVLSKPTGLITLFSAAGSATWATFTVTNTVVAATDTIIVEQTTGANTYNVIVSAVAAGSFKISVSAVVGTATEAPTIRFTVLKSVSA